MSIHCARRCARRCANAGGVGCRLGPAELPGAPCGGRCARGRLVRQPAARRAGADRPRLCNPDIGRPDRASRTGSGGYDSVADRGRAGLERIVSDRLLRPCRAHPPSPVVAALALPAGRTALGSPHYRAAVRTGADQQAARQDPGTAGDIPFRWHSGLVHHCGHACHAVDRALCDLSDNWTPTIRGGPAPCLQSLNAI